jgi:hypothetical protein
MSNIVLKKQTTDRVKVALDVITKKLTAMEELQNSPSKTNGIFNWNGRTGNEVVQSSHNVDINEISNVAYLLSILGFIQTREKEYTEAAKTMEINPVPLFKWSNYSKDAWENDIKIRLSVLMQHEEIEKLTKQREFLAKYISEDDQVMAFLEDILPKE